MIFKGPHLLKQAQTNIYIFLPMIESFYLVVAGRIEGLRDHPGKLRLGS